MKKEELPQDDGALASFTKELCYVKNDAGKYETALSTGWDVKGAALDSAWDEVNRRIEEARLEVVAGRKSPVYYFMEKKLMDISILSDYSGFWSITTKRHFSPSIFKKLSQSRLDKYAEVFEITVEELKNFKG